jgi:hypothetical protein
MKIEKKEILARDRSEGTTLTDYEIGAVGKACVSPETLDYLN